MFVWITFDFFVWLLTLNSLLLLLLKGNVINKYSIMKGKILNKTLCQGEDKSSQCQKNLVSREEMKSNSKMGVLFEVFPSDMQCHQNCS